MNDDLREALRQMFGNRFREIAGSVVLVPENEREVAHLMRLARRHQSALFPSAQISRERFGSIELIEPRSALVSVGAGVQLSSVETALEPHGLTLGPLSPGAWRLDVATFLESGYAGLRVVSGGRLESTCLSLIAMMPDELVYRSMPAPRSAAGPDLDAVFLGGGGRTGLILGATLRCQMRPSASRVARHSFPRAEGAVDSLRASLADGCCFESARLERRGERILLEVLVVGTPENVENDLFTIGHQLFPRGGRASGHVMGSPPSVPEREASWDNICTAVDSGRPVQLFRMAMDSAIAIGEVEGMTLEGSHPWHASTPAEFTSSVDVDGVLGGRP